mmetsp:Transcript_23746/g.49994  ORF Transcript_23746/g.49994 Transcript_23746/m.49994 type:complete len:232 (+) Transcript_23746:462-1157(+)
MRRPVAAEQHLPVVLGPEPPQHEGGDPFLVRALGAQDGSGPPPGQFRVEDLGDGRALDGAPQQNADQPHEARRVAQPHPLAVPAAPLDPPLDHHLVGTVRDPHAPAAEKILRVALRVPPVLVDAVHTVLGKVAVDVGAGDPQQEPARIGGDGGAPPPAQRRRETGGGVAEGRQQIGGFVGNESLLVFFLVPLLLLLLLLSLPLSLPLLEYQSRCRGDCSGRRRRRRCPRFR